MGPRTKYFTNIHKHKSQVQFDKKLGPTGSRTRGLVVNCIQHCIKPCNINLRPTHIDGRRASNNESVHSHLHAGTNWTFRTPEIRYSWAKVGNLQIHRNVVYHGVPNFDPKSSTKGAKFTQTPL